MHMKLDKGQKRKLISIICNKYTKSKEKSVNNSKQKNIYKFTFFVYYMKYLVNAISSTSILAFCQLIPVYLHVTIGGLCVKIAFWSNCPEECRVSANLAAISVASVIRYPYSIIAMENRLSSNNLGKAFMGSSRECILHEAGANYYDGRGLEGLVRKIYRGEVSKEILQPYLKEIISDHLYYIPQSGVIHNEIFDYELNYCIHPLLEIIEEYADICLIDASIRQILSTKAILEEADLIVVNLCQKQSVLENFFQNYSSIIPKALFIISNYEFNSRMNYKRIAQMYELPLDCITVIPDNELYDIAYEKGSAVEFLSRNYSCSNDSSNYFFIQAVKKAAYMMIKKAVYLSKKKDNTPCLR